MFSKITTTIYEQCKTSTLRKREHQSKFKRKIKKKIKENLNKKNLPENIVQVSK